MMLRRSLSLWLASVCLVADWRAAHAISLDVNDSGSIKAAASTIAYGMMSYYYGNQTGNTPGNLPPPYYWWECGAMFGHMVDYWYSTGDDTYVDETIQALDWQASKAGTFMPSNQTTTEGNDDQVFWAFAVMGAAEANFPSPASGYPSWLAMAQAVFNLQTTRWDLQTCGGGLRWQIFPTNNGYTYRNNAANGGFFLLASRLARYTGNDTYIKWAEREWEWFSTSVLLDNSTWAIYDGTSDVENCTSANHLQWSYNYGFWFTGMAYLYNHTQDEKWLAPMHGILNATLDTFFPPKMGPKIMVEIQCEPYGTCDTDDYTFKSFVMRWLAVTTQLVPSTASLIWPYIQTSAVGAAGQCDGGSNGVTCGFEWNTTTWDGLYGVGQQMSALAAVQANLILTDNLKPPYTTDTGGTSKGDPSAGTGSGADGGDLPTIDTSTISTSDKAGAGILTALVLIFTLGGAAWLVVS